MRDKTGGAEGSAKASVGSLQRSPAGSQFASSGILRVWARFRGKVGKRKMHSHSGEWTWGTLNFPPLQTLAVPCTGCHLPAHSEQFSVRNHHQCRYLYCKSCLINLLPPGWPSPVTGEISSSQLKDMSRRRISDQSSGSRYPSQVGKASSKGPFPASIASPMDPNVPASPDTSAVPGVCVRSSWQDEAGRSGWLLLQDFELCFLGSRAIDGPFFMPLRNLTLCPCQHGDISNQTSPSWGQFIEGSKEDFRPSHPVVPTSRTGDGCGCGRPHLGSPEPMDVWKSPVSLAGQEGTCGHTSLEPLL
ncbi:sin3 histone deacetylase corepressor complex component SDS3 isoform 2-T4 [Ciconia maguari]